MSVKNSYCQVTRWNLCSVTSNIFQVQCGNQHLLKHWGRKMQWLFPVQTFTLSLQVISDSVQLLTLQNKHNCLNSRATLEYSKNNKLIALLRWLKNGFTISCSKELEGKSRSMLGKVTSMAQKMKPTAATAHLLRKELLKKRSTYRTLCLPTQDIVRTLQSSHLLVEYINIINSLT